MVSTPHPATDFRILSLPGGPCILEARAAARRLIDRLPGLGRLRGGAADGLEDLSRRGRLEHLVMSEHLVDDDEFFRRRFQGEQIHLSRQALAPSLWRAAVVWDLGIAVLGAPRLSAIGLALALRQRGIEEGSSPRFLVNGEREIDLGLLDGVREALELPPPYPDTAGHALRRDPVRALDGAVFLITSDTATAERAARERASLSAVFLVEERRMVLLLPGRGGDWVLEAAVSATVAP